MTGIPTQAPTIPPTILLLRLAPLLLVPLRTNLRNKRREKRGKGKGAAVVAPPSQMIGKEDGTAGRRRTAEPPTKGLRLMGLRSPWALFILWKLMMKRRKRISRWGVLLLWRFRVHSERMLSLCLIMRMGERRLLRRLSGIEAAPKMFLSCSTHHIYEKW